LATFSARISVETCSAKRRTALSRAAFTRSARPLPPLTFVVYA
jgi:hypothetical protein